MFRFAIVLWVLAQSFPAINGIFHGDIAVYGQFPYQALIKVKSQRSACSGVLISKLWILTAAHCLEDVYAVDVHLGALAFRYKGNEDGRILYKDVSEIFLHDLYNADIRRNDIALIKLPVKVTFSAYIRPAVLPTRHVRTEGEIVVASGWGQEGDTKKPRSDTLNFAYLTIINSGECARELFMVRKTHVCAKGGGGRENICKGDSGGPLVRKGTRLLIGIASYGDSSCEVGLPAAFIRVSSYLDWIRKHTGL